MQKLNGKINIIQISLTLGGFLINTVKNIHCQFQANDHLQQKVIQLSNISCTFQNDAELEKKIREFQIKLVEIKQLVEKIISKYGNQPIDIYEFIDNPKPLEDIVRNLESGEYKFKQLNLPISECKLLHLHQFFMLFCLCTQYVYQNDPNLLFVIKPFLQQILKPLFKKHKQYLEYEKKLKDISKKYSNIQLTYQNIEDLKSNINEDFKNFKLLEELSKVEQYYLCLILQQYHKGVHKYLIQLRRALKHFYISQKENLQNYIKPLIIQELTKFENENQYFDNQRLNDLKDNINSLLDNEFENNGLDNIENCLMQLNDTIEFIQQNKFKLIETKTKLFSSSAIRKNYNNQTLDIFYLYLFGSGIIAQKTNKQKIPYYTDMRTAIKKILNNSYALQDSQNISILKLCENIFQQKSTIIQQIIQQPNISKDIELQLVSDPQKISKTITICITGFLNEDKDGKQYWKEIDNFDDSIVIYCKWASGKQMDYIFPLISQLTKFVQNEALKKLGGAEYEAQYDIEGVVNELTSIFNNKQQEAKYVGEFLAQLIQNNYFGEHILNFAGHSLGVQAIYSMFRQLDLSKTQPKKIVDTVLLLGGVVDIQEVATNRWNWLAGEVINVYSKKDDVLKRIYKTQNLFATPCGIKKVPKIYRPIRNFNFTSFISGHTNYYDNLKEILIQTDFHNDFRKYYSDIEYETSEERFNSFLQGLKI